MIYTSLTPSIPIPTTSVFTLLFQPDSSTAYIGRFPGSHPAFIDANTATTLSRSTLRSLSLSLGYGLTQSTTTYPGLHKLAKGDTIMIFSPNSLAWPIILFGSVAAGLRCTLANSAYTPGELQYQWTDSGAKVVFVHPSLVRVVMEMFKTGLGLGDDEARRRVVVSGSEWLTGVQDEGGLISSPMIIIEKCVGILRNKPISPESYTTPLPSQSGNPTTGSPL
jgi:4-coumarate--CoA ligase